MYNVIPSTISFNFKVILGNTIGNEKEPQTKYECGKDLRLGFRK